MSSHSTLSQRFSSLSDIPLESWEDVVTIATVFAAANQLRAKRFPPKLQGELIDIFADKLATAVPNGVKGFEDCKQMFERTYDTLVESPEYRQDRRFLIPDALGTWIVWNVLGRAPTSPEELAIVRAIGVLVIQGICDWWDA